MFRTLLLLSTLILTQSTLASIRGNRTITLTSMCDDIILTNDQEFLLCTHSFTINLEIFKNNGFGFESHQLLQFDSVPGQLTMAPNSKIYVLCQNDLKVIKQEANGTFTQSILLALSTAFSFFLISKDEEMLILGSSSVVEIWRKNPTDYTLHQTLPHGIGSNGLALSADEKEILICSSFLIIYKHNGANFVLSQNILLGFFGGYVNYINGLVEVHGSSSQLKFYEFDGTEYVYKFDIQTG